jgi:hypothetical protein
VHRLNPLSITTETPMTLLKTLWLPGLLVLALAGCHRTDTTTAASEPNFAKAMTTYLAKRGDLCIGRGTWPIDVTQEELALGSRNALQMPVLEKLGLAASVPMDHGRRYQLTESGKQYFLAREPRRNASAARSADHDLCAGRLSLRKVVRWDPPTSGGEGAQTVLTYTYDMAPAPWTADVDARRVFPVVDRIVRGAGVLELKESMVLTREGWQAKDL